MFFINKSINPKIEMKPIEYKFDKKMETPDTPEELVGQEPSLFDLLRHYMDNKEDYGELDGDVLNKYNIT